MTPLRFEIVKEVYLLSANKSKGVFYFVEGVMSASKGYFLQRVFW
jgi:hypothetical protein